jgi:hypothetical protein
MLVGSIEQNENNLGRERKILWLVKRRNARPVTTEPGLGKH